VAGDQVGYSVGNRIGPALLRRPDGRFFRREHLDRSQRYFEEHGSKTIVLARFVPIVRTFAPVLAGVGRMPYRRFASFNIVGGVAWAAGVTLFGFTAGRVIGADQVDRFLLPIIGVIVLASVAPVLLERRRHRRAVMSPESVVAAVEVRGESL
jgi:membrane-associated protein